MIDFTRNYLRVPRGVVRELLASHDHDALVLYLALLDRVAFSAGPRATRGHGIVHLDVGELVVGRAELAAFIGASESTIRTSIKRLQDRQLIAVHSTKLGTRVKVHGLDEKPDDIAVESPSISPRVQPSISPTSHQPIDQASRHYQDLRSEIRNEERESPRPAGPSHGNRDDERARELASAAVDAINSHAGTRYEAASAETVKNARALLKAKVTADDVRAVVAFKWCEWAADDKMRLHFKPSTLLRPSNFQRYREDIVAGAQRKPAVAVGPGLSGRPNVERPRSKLLGAP